MRFLKKTHFQLKNDFLYIKFCFALQEFEKKNFFRPIKCGLFFSKFLSKKGFKNGKKIENTGSCKIFKKKFSERLFGGCSKKIFFVFLALGRSGAERRRSRSGAEWSPAAKKTKKSFFQKKKSFFRIASKKSFRKFFLKSFARSCVLDFFPFFKPFLDKNFEEA